MAAIPMAMPSPAAAGSVCGPVVVVGAQFCAPYVVDLTVTKKALSLSDSDFTVTDINGNVVLKVKGVVFSLRDRAVLVDAADNPLLTLQQKAQILTLFFCNFFLIKSTFLSIYPAKFYQIANGSWYT